LTLKQIESFNKSIHACTVVAVLELDISDSHVATKIAISNPMASEDCPDSLNTLAVYLKENKIYNIKDSFKSILKGLLDIRVRLPTIFSIDARHILVNS
jgi:hypothetical protein